MSELHPTHEVHGHDNALGHDSAHGHDDGLFDSKKPPFDREVNVKAVLVSAVIGIVITVLSFVTMWWLFLALKGWEESKDPAPSPFQEQIQNYKPPAPNLQEYPPTTDIEAFYEWEDEMLTTYGLVDEETGVARIPIERAMELALERGFPTREGAGLQPELDGVELPDSMTVEAVEGDLVEGGETSVETRDPGSTDSSTDLDARDDTATPPAEETDENGSGAA